MAAGKRTDDPAGAILQRTLIDENGCWVWQGCIARTGYGNIRVSQKTWLTHRLAYETFVGPIPDGFQIDHLCRVRACCNPEHLEPVTPWENALRSPLNPAYRTHCPQGHEYTPENTQWARTGGGRHCRICRREVMKRLRIRKAMRAAGIAA